MAILRTEFPKVRSLRKAGATYYEVDCRRKGWAGKQRLTFNEKAVALAKAREIVTAGVWDATIGMAEQFGGWLAMSQRPTLGL